MYIEETVNTRFFDLQIDNPINWKNHIEQIIPKCIRICYAIRSVAHISNINTLSNQFTIHTFTLLSNIFWGVTLPAVRRFSLNKIKSSELWLVLNPEPLAEVYLNN
jgi:hypothetical protein